MKLAQTRLTIIGLGMMGGSLAAALKGRCHHITGVDGRRNVVKRAAETGWVDESTDDAASALSTCDLAVLAVPVRASLGILKRIGEDLPRPPRLLDIGSTKVQVLNAMRTLPPEVDPIGGHPLCGKEAAGLEAADGRLYREANFALMPLSRTSSETRALAEEMVLALGAIPITLEEERHDRLVALTSHLPYLLAAALVSRAMNVAKQDEMLKQLLASGFQDSSRLAASNPTMMLDILLTNHEYILAELEGLQAELDAWRKLLSRNDETALAQRLQGVRQAKIHLNSGHG